MIPYKLDYAIDKSFTSNPSGLHTLLEVYTGSRISTGEAKMLSRKIADHKWYVSERLNRDVGFHVAAVDFVENFYEPDSVRHGDKLFEFSRTAFKAVGSAVKAYLKAKGRSTPL